MLRRILVCAALLTCAPPAYAGPGVVGLYQVPLGANGRSVVDDLLRGPDGNLWYSDHDAAVIGKLTPTGSFSLLQLPPGAAPEGLTTAVTGPVLYADAGRSAFGRISADGTLTELPMALETPGALPTSILGLPDLPFSFWTAGPYYGLMSNFGSWGGRGLSFPAGVTAG